MLAKATEQIPAGNFFYEPKWDGFRALIFVSESVAISSRGEKDLTRYFPELVAEVARQLPNGVVIDGEIIVPLLDAQGRGELDFSALQQRIHPADSRIARLAKETPAHFVAFDLLQDQGQELLSESFGYRRKRLEELMQKTEPPLHITASTREREIALRWFEQFEGAGLDGVVAKDEALIYHPGERAMLKVKHFRTAECVVGGIRPYKGHDDAVGALLLGLFDDVGLLHYVGSTSSFATTLRHDIFEILRPLQRTSHTWLTPREGQRVPGNISRWTGKKDLGFIPIDPQVVCEVRYDQLEGERFRHTSSFLRWRPDREASSCTFAQLELPKPYDLLDVMR